MGESIWSAVFGSSPFVDGVEKTWRDLSETLSLICRSVFRIPIQLLQQTGWLVSTSPFDLAPSSNDYALEADSGLEMRKREFESFCKSVGEEYGYSGFRIDDMKEREFSRLGSTIYLDHAGTTLYSETQMRNIASDLGTGIFSNPHSRQVGGGTAVDIEAARRKVLAMLNTTPDEYLCIFTSGATSAMKMVGEAFPWSPQSHFSYTLDNHNSVVGIREYALEKGSGASAAQVHSMGGGRFEVSVLKRQKRSCVDEDGMSQSRPAFSLFAFPSESNFSGTQYSLDIVDQIKNKSCIGLSDEGSLSQSWFVLVDAAKSCCTSPPDLSKYKPDFVALSFYKIFGYPTGLGALIVQKSAASVLRKGYFGGGAVQVAISQEDFYRVREGESGWEDGTLPFLSIHSIFEGFSRIEALTFPAIRSHTAALTKYAAHRMQNLRHYNGHKVVMLYGHHEQQHGPEDLGFEVGQGPIVCFNITRSDGSYVGYKEVERLGDVHSMIFRTGCFCNPGACSMHLDLSPEDIRHNFEQGHVCWDDKDVINGRPTGAVRISFGYMSTFEDVDAFLGFISRSYVEESPPPSLSIPVDSPGEEYSKLILEGIYLYPVKSCKGFRVSKWPVTPSGLVMDRQFAIKGESGIPLTQKTCPKLVQITPRIDLQNMALHLSAPRMSNVLIGLDCYGCANALKGLSSSAEEMLSGESMNSREEVDSWLSKFLQTKCKLVSMATEGATSGKALKNFSNQGGCLLVSKMSVRATLLNSNDGSNVNHDDLDATCSQFRPNFLVDGGKAFEEEDWDAIRVGSVVFRKEADCSRCGVICIDQSTGEQRGPGLLRAIAKNPAKKKKGLKFGILLEPRTSGNEEHSPEPSILSAGFLSQGSEVCKLSLQDVG